MNNDVVLSVIYINLRGWIVEMDTRFNALVRYLTIVSILFGLSACGTAPINIAREGTVNLEYSSSRNLHFSLVGIYRNEVGVLITGELHKRSHGRGSIPGHIDIEIISPDGAILAIKSTNYKRGSIKSRRSQFAVEILIDLPINSTVRIMHNDALLRGRPKS